MADAPTFNFRGKQYAANRFAVTPAEPGKRTRVVDLGKRAAADLRRQGYIIEPRGGVPTFVRLEGARPIIVRDGVQYVRNPLLRADGKPSNRLVAAGSPQWRKIEEAGWELHEAPRAGPADAPAGYMRLRQRLPEMAMTGHESWPAFKAAVAAFAAANPSGQYAIRLANGATFVISSKNGKPLTTTGIYDAVTLAMAVGSDQDSRQAIESAITSPAAPADPDDDADPTLRQRLAGAVLIPVGGRAYDHDQAALYADQPVEVFAASSDGYCVRTALQAWDPAADWSQVPDCSNGDDMRNLVESAGITIRVWSSARDDAPTFLYQPARAANRGRICDLWHQFAHCLLLPTTKARSIHAQLFPADAPTVIVRAERRRVARAVPRYAPEDEARLLVADIDPSEPMPVPVGEVVEEFDADLSAEAALLERMYAAALAEPVLPIVLGESSKIIAFRTATAVYKAADRDNHTVLEQCPDTWTDCGAALQVFYARHGRPHLARRFAELRASDVVTPAIMFRSGVPDRHGFVDATGYEYDVAAAYRSSHTFPQFTGFPDPAGPRDWVAWDPVLLDPAQPFEGLVWVETDLDYPATVFERRKMAAPLPQVRYALARGEVFQIGNVFLARRHAGDVFEHVKARMRELGGPNPQTAAALEKSVISQLIGRGWRSEKREIRTVTTPAECAALQLEGLTLLREERCGDHAIYFLRQAPEPVDRLYPDLVQYVHAYTKLLVFDELVRRLPEAGLSWADIKSIWCDGVLLARPLPAGFLDARRWKTKEHLGKPRELAAVALDTTAARLAPPPVTAQFMPAAVHPRVVLLGPPGSGKTHRILRDWVPGRNVRLTATTRCAAAALAREALPAGTPPPTTIQKLLTQVAKSGEARRDLMGFCRLVVDEFTMLTLAQLDALEEVGVPLLLSGDFAQLAAVCPEAGDDQPITRAELARRGYFFVDIGEDENRRAADDETKALYRALRTLGDADDMLAAAAAAGVRRAAAADVPYPAAGARAHFVAAHNATVTAQNLAYCHAIAAPGARVVQFGAAEGRKRDTRLEAPFTPGMLLIGVRSDKKGAIDNQEIVEAVEYVTRQGRRTEGILVRRADGSVTKVAPALLNPAYAITFHRLQGQTLDCPLAVDLAGIFDHRMLYVAITRVRRLAQLTLVGDTR